MLDQGEQFSEFILCHIRQWSVERGINCSQVKQVKSPGDAFAKSANQRIFQSRSPQPYKLLCKTREDVSI